MEILFLSTWFPHPMDNGSKIRVHHLLRALAMQHRITLISFAWGTADPEGAAVLHDSLAEVLAIRHNPFQPGAWARRLRFFSMAPVVARPLPKMSRVVRSALARTDWDLVIASTGVMAPYAHLAPVGVPRLLEEHNSMARWMRERYRQPAPALQRLRRWTSWQKSRLYESRLLRRFDLCTMVSEQDRLATLSMLPGYRGPVEVVSNGVDCDRNRPGLVPSIPGTLVFSGALTYEANYDAMRYFASQILPLIQRELPDVSLTITGSTDGVDLDGLGSHPGIRFSGFLEDVRPVVAGAWGCVVPIRQGGGTRLKVLEALALGTPVIATSKAIEGLDLRPEEHLLVGDSPAAFAHQVIRLHETPGLRQELARVGRRLVEERYDWQSIGARFRMLCERTVALR